MNEPRAMKEIHDIREKIHERTKKMTENEVTEYYANATREVEEMYALKFRRPDNSTRDKSVAPT
jgi:hypothetical protein